MVSFPNFRMRIFPDGLVMYTLRWENVYDFTRKMSYFVKSWRKFPIKNSKNATLEGKCILCFWKEFSNLGWLFFRTAKWPFAVILTTVKYVISLLVQVKLLQEPVMVLNFKVNFSSLLREHAQIQLANCKPSCIFHKGFFARTAHQTAVHRKMQCGGKIEWAFFRKNSKKNFVLIFAGFGFVKFSIYLNNWEFAWD